MPPPSERCLVSVGSSFFLVFFGALGDGVFSVDFREAACCFFHAAAAFFSLAACSVLYEFQAPMPRVAPATSATTATAPAIRVPSRGPSPGCRAASVNASIRRARSRRLASSFCDSLTGLPNPSSAPPDPTAVVVPRHRPV
ncbi:hypothetical protein ACWV95_20095 [Streptomyces albus]